MDFVDTKFGDPNGRNHLMDHPDLNVNGGGAHLQRHKTERHRLQCLQRTLTTASMTSVPSKAPTALAKWRVWMINEGGRQLFFGVFILLHLLVGILGFLHYQYKDNLNNARHMFGLGFCE